MTTPAAARRGLLAAALGLPLAGLGCRGEPAASGAWSAGWVDGSVGGSVGAGMPGPGAASGGAARGHAWRDGRWQRPGVGADQRAAVAIVGAGVAGLAAARALVRGGVDDFCLFELEDQPGGNARAHAMGGQACPLGAHYLPLPGPAAHEVSEWLHEIGLARSRFGRTEYDERHLCHAPQERLFLPDPQGRPGAGQWLEGLWPAAPPPADLLAQVRRLAAEVRRLQRTGAFAVPTWRAPWRDELAALDRQTFDAWLAAGGYHATALRWHLDYCCRDEYGAGSAQVSAWAGLHYFASRHGLRLPGNNGSDDDGEPAGVLTWPEGNAWLTARLAAGLGERLRPGTLVTRIAPQRHCVTVDTWQPATGRAQRWQVRQVIVCVPLPWAARLLDPAPPALAAAVGRLRHAPWLVSNLQLRAPLLERLGPPLSWDNVLHDAAAAPAAGGDGLPASLGYVNAAHQALGSAPHAPVLTHYWALGGASDAAARHWRRALLDDRDGSAWASRVVADLARAHPDLPRKLVRVDLMRYGHAMSIPVPGVRTDAAGGALAALAQPQHRLHFAHADLSGYSVFEEAFTHGSRMGEAVARR